MSVETLMQLCFRLSMNTRFASVVIVCVMGWTLILGAISFGLWLVIEGLRAIF
jgi:hypothetical protein